MREIIQISAVPYSEGNLERCREKVYALCNDGTLWKYLPQNEEWVSLPPIPQVVNGPIPEKPVSGTGKPAAYYGNESVEE